MSAFLADAANLGTALAPVAVAVGAVTAALYARGNHKEQLLQALALQQESLNHDRAMSDRTALRALLDQVGKDITDATDGLIRAQNRIIYLDEYRDMLDELHRPPPHRSSEELSDEFKEEVFTALDAEKSAWNALADAQAAVGRVGPAQFRLRMRLADAEEIVTSHRIVCDALVAWLHDANRNELPLRPRNAAALEGHSDSTRDAFDDFLNACREWFRENPAPPEPYTSATP